MSYANTRTVQYMLTSKQTVFSCFLKFQNTMKNIKGVDILDVVFFFSSNIFITKEANILHKKRSPQLETLTHSHTFIRRLFYVV